MFTQDAVHEEVTAEKGGKQEFCIFWSVIVTMTLWVPNSGMQQKKWLMVEWHSLSDFVLIQTEWQDVFS